VTQQRTVKSLLSFVCNSSAWCAAFVPNGQGIQWAVIQEGAKGPLLRSYGFDTTGEKAASQIPCVASDTIYRASVLPSLSTLCKQVSLPFLQPKEIQAALIDTLEQTVAVEIGESLVAYESYPNDDGTMTVTAYLAKQAAVHDHLSYLQSLSIDPEWVIPKAPCLAAFLAHFSLDGWQYVIDICTDEITVVLMFNGHVIESRALVGRSSVFIALEQPSPENDESLRHVLQQLTEVIIAYKERYGLEAGLPVTVTGDVLSFKHAATVIAEFVQIPLSPLHSTVDDASLLQCAGAVGAAFLIQPKNSTGCIPNFRIGKIAFASPLLHWKRPLIALGIGCLLAASSIVWYGSSRSRLIVEEMRNDWKKITAVAHTSPEEVVKQTERAIGPISLQPTPEQLLAMGDWLLASVERQTSYPFHPDVPRVTDLISWLSIQLEEIMKTPPMTSEKFEIQALHYQLVKHPTKSHPKERYQVRVDLDFTTPSVALARVFHDRLVTPNTCIDTASEVKWLPGNGKYRTTFFLKDKTYYPPQLP
jgi:type IV pilus assembly protein PilM